MNIREFSVDGIDAVVGWKDHDLESWRNREDPDEGTDWDDDEDHPCPKDIIAVLGFDPSTIDWGND